MKNEIIYECKNGIEYIQFKRLLELGIKHAYTLKSQDINFSSKSKYMQKAYSNLLNALELEENTLIVPKQTHTSNVKCVFEVGEFTDVDGLITNKKQITLASRNADCILFLLYDPVKKVIANVHSGWRGTFQKIVEKAVLKMITNYKSEAKDIICCICPSIRECHFEVEEDVKELCERIFGFMENVQAFIKKGEIKENKQKYLIDTVEINKVLLKELGLKDENIIDCKMCSVCNSNKVSSRRAEGENYTIATAIISLD